MNLQTHLILYQNYAHDTERKSHGQMYKETQQDMNVQARRNRHWHYIGVWGVVYLA